ncbi:hypothetical protein PDUR_08965 [Paenibacillus durus]|uniref:Uncharacterized protein n=1 Tax=Paenibacillus durus TaxID=44251 RepID=A0A089HJA7_PAEDU|nr:hypothetical protein PDUR_08965 [Paenibacillus durus]
MKKSTPILSILQSMLTSEEVQSVIRLAKYEDNACKFTVYHLLHYWCMATFEQWIAIGLEPIMPLLSGCYRFIIRVFRVKLQPCLFLYSRRYFICLFVNVVE